MAYIYAEKIVLNKHQVREQNRKRGKPILGIYRNQSKVFFTGEEANYIPEGDVISQYPARKDLEIKPGTEAEPDYDMAFKKYIIDRALTKPKAWIMFQSDYPEYIPKNIGQPGYALELAKARKNFIEAMRRREKSLTR